MFESCGEVSRGRGSVTTAQSDVGTASPGVPNEERGSPVLSAAAWTQNLKKMAPPEYKKI